MHVNPTLYSRAASNPADGLKYPPAVPDEAAMTEVTESPDSTKKFRVGWEAEDTYAIHDSNQSPHTQGGGAIGFDTSKPKDAASNLTRRLVAASGQFEVRQIMTDANKDLVELRIIAATAKGEDAATARSCVKKLEKLLTRAVRKIRDLDGEDILKLQKTRAQQRRQRERAEEIKAELRTRLFRRQARENGYLLEDLQDKLPGSYSRNANSDPSMKLDAASEAAITAQAGAIAAAESASVTAGDIGGGEVASTPAGAADSSGETSLDAAAPEGGVDIAI